MKKYIYTFILGVVVLFCGLNYWYSERTLPVNINRVNSVKAVVVEAINTHEGLQLISTTDGGRVKGGGWGCSVLFVSKISLDETINATLIPVQTLLNVKNITINKNRSETFYSIYKGNIVATLYYNPAEQYWVLEIISNP